MHNVFKGIVVGFLGLIVWLLASLIGGIMEGLSGVRDPVLYALMTLGFFIMVGGPLCYIVVIPIVNWWRRRRRPHPL